MNTEIIFALVITGVFIVAIMWLVIYSHRQHRKSPRSEQQALPSGRRVGEVSRRVVVRRQVAKR
jgi:hypothetical protein